MYKKYVDECDVILDLKRPIIGVQFLFIKEEYDDINAEELYPKSSFCSLISKAMKGKKVIKADKDSFGCQGGPEMLGMKPVSNFVRSGRQFKEFGLYADLAVARQAQNDLCFIEQKIYGVAAGPLEMMEDADVVLFLANPWQIMRVMQGYTFYHGMAKNLGMIGNQGICADLTSRPYFMNDMNISVLCMGARLHLQAEDWEMGVGMPAHLFEDIVKGLKETLNMATDEKRKKELIRRMEEKEVVDLSVEHGEIYMGYGKKMKYPEELYKKL